MALTFDDELERLLNPSNDMGGGAGPRDASAIAKLIMGGGSASLEGQQLFGQPVDNKPAAPAKKPLSRSLQAVLDSADQIATSLGSVHSKGSRSGGPSELEEATYKGVLANKPYQDVLEASEPDPFRRQINKELAPQREQYFKDIKQTLGQTLLPNPYGPGSYDPQDKEQVAQVQAQGKKVAETDRSQQLLNSLSANPAFTQLPKDGQSEIIKGLLTQMGVTQSEEQKAFAKAKGTAAGTQEGQGMDKSVDSVAAKVANYALPLPSGFALRSPYWQNVLQRAVELNPTFDATNYKARQVMRTDFASGRNSRNIVSLNTAVDHLSNLAKAGETLSNSPVQVWNYIKNKGLEQTGDKRVVEFKNAATAVESELASVFKGTGATDQEIKQWRANLSSAQSPEQLQGAVAQAVKLMQGRLDAIDNIWLQTMGSPRDIPVFSKKSRQIIDDLGLSTELSDTAETVESTPGKGSAPAGKVLMINSKGQRGYVPAHQVEEALKTGYKKG